MHTQYNVVSATIHGVEAVQVIVEVSITSGLPGIAIVGMPDLSIQEARERIRSALRACGFIMPSQKVVVNLAPGSIRKSGSGFDLPIAVALLAASKQIPRSAIEGSLIVGELSLEGQVRPVRGLLAHAVRAKSEGLRLICAEPDEGLVELEGLEQLSVSTLSQFRSASFNKTRTYSGKTATPCPDYSEVSGHVMAKRALQVAAAGMHGVLMVGPPGSGKTMLASRMPSILPPLEKKEILESALIHSVAGADFGNILAGLRPFRSPHHSISTAALTGGGSLPKPGEISLAHNGVLFLDELAEFKQSTLQSIRQPMESGLIIITRATAEASFPANFMLIAASNPCPCGYFGDPAFTCSCSGAQVRAYQNRIGGPLLDRFDIHIDVRRPQASQIIQDRDNLSSEEMFKGVMRARLFAKKHGLETRGASKRTSLKTLLKKCQLDSSTSQFLEDTAQASHMSGRGIYASLSLARSIANIEEELRVSKVHICEALSLRIREY